MWRVEPESKKVELEIRKMIQFNEIDLESLELINLWIRSLEVDGPYYLMLNKRTWNDHELVGHWAGYRSSCFSKTGRIIYKIDRLNRKIKIASITTDHNYSRG
jgi:mRNA-degrading endonuclease YafQ of YafQ-DinJ toxin-antitoxin module